MMGPQGGRAGFLACVGPQGAGAFPAGRGRRHSAVQGVEEWRDRGAGRGEVRDSALEPPEGAGPAGPVILGLLTSMTGRQ